MLASKAQGVVLRWNLRGDDMRCKMVGEDAPPICHNGLAIVFLDFRRHDDRASPLTDVMTAEKIWGAWLGAGQPTRRWRYYDKQEG